MGTSSCREAPGIKLKGSDIVLSCRLSRRARAREDLFTPSCWWNGVMWLCSGCFCGNKRLSVCALPSAPFMPFFFPFTPTSTMIIAFDRGSQPRNHSDHESIYCADCSAAQHDRPNQKELAERVSGEGRRM